MPRPENHEKHQAPRVLPCHPRRGCCGVSEGELLTGDGVTQGSCGSGTRCGGPLRPFSLTVQAYLAHLRDAGFTGAPLPFGVDEQRSEEHTSELQSLRHLVCRLLLEKK